MRPGAAFFAGAGVVIISAQVGEVIATRIPFSSSESELIATMLAVAVRALNTLRASSSSSELETIIVLCVLFVL